VPTELANFLFEAVNFGLLAGGLSWLLFKPVRGALDAEQHRREEEEHELASRSEALTQGEMKLQAERKGFEEQLASERDRAMESARAEAQEILKAARAEAETRQEEQDRARQYERSEILSSLSDSVALVAATSLRRLLDSLDGPELDLALVRAACSEIALMQTPIAGSIVVETARPLSPAAREVLESHLPQGFVLRDAPFLGAGVRITTAQGLVEASSLAFARQTAEQVAMAIVTTEDRHDATA
jgi:F0F1-type ATP synthase membrane subunit b/b'